MNCDRARAALSARMDGERLSARAAAVLESHLRTCAACRAFERGAWKLREAARFEVVPAVPDLVEPIMEAVEAEARRTAQARLRVLPAREVRPPGPLFPRLARSLAPVAAALVVGLIAGSLAVGGPWRSPGGGTQVAAADVSAQVLRAAARLNAYEAQFAITEHNFAPDVPVRELAMSVWFQAPERFRLDVADHTRYPSDLFTPTDLQLVVDGSTWYSSGPAPCPTTSCPPKEVLVTNRVPFSSSTPTPTDLVLPVTTLADANQLTVVGRGQILGREAVKVELPFDRATGLFPFLELGGSWRPFFPNDRVVLWLDVRSWFPLGYEVYPAGGRERDEWALRFGLPEEPSRRPIFQVTALSVSERTPDAGTFAIPRVGGARDQGAQAVTLTDAKEETGFEPVTPAKVDGLDLYQVVLPPADETSRKPDETLLTYSEGLTWLKVGETRAWTGDTFYGPVGTHAEEVPLGNGGVAYYEPATDEHGRRLAIHAAGTDLYLETNLSRQDLLDVASSLPVTGMPIPEAWSVRESPKGVTERMPLDEAVAEVPFPVDLPSELPPGYVLASAELVRLGEDVGLNVYYQQAAADLGAGPIRLHIEAATELPPAASAEQSTVEVGDVQGRWTPDTHRLEWVVNGVYYSLDAPGLGLEDLLGVAETMTPFPATASSPALTPTAAPSRGTEPPEPLEP